ncbi:hypothetical protein D3C87_2104330 [compost metagenome]
MLDADIEVGVVADPRRQMHHDGCGLDQVATDRVGLAMIGQQGGQAPSQGASLDRRQSQPGV